MNEPTPSRYQWSWRGVTFDFYRLCEILGLKSEPQKHAIKKLIRAGQSIKSTTQDINEAIDALERWMQMIDEDEPLGLIWSLVKRFVGAAGKGLAGDPSTINRGRTEWKAKGVSISWDDLKREIGISNADQDAAILLLITAGNHGNCKKDDIRAAIQGLERWKEMIREDAESEPPKLERAKLS